MGVFNWEQLPKPKYPPRGKLIGIVSIRHAIDEHGCVWRWFTDNGHQTWLPICTLYLERDYYPPKQSRFVKWEQSLKQ